MNDVSRSVLPQPPPSDFATSSCLARSVFCLLCGVCLVSALSGQTSVAISNAGFESPTPTVFDDYTVGATGWTRTSTTINAGTFDPTLSGALPEPIDGTQVGYADGFGGLQQVLADTYAANQVYTFSVHIGFRSDERNSDHGTGAIMLGYFDSGSFTPLAWQSTSVGLGQFDLVTGSYLSTGAELGAPIALRLTNLDSFQVIFDTVQLSASPVPEPSAIASVLGAAALAGTLIFRRRRGSPGAATQ